MGMEKLSVQALMPWYEGSHSHPLLALAPTTHQYYLLIDLHQKIWQDFLSQINPTFIWKWLDLSSELIWCNLVNLATRKYEQYQFPLYLRKTLVYI